ncbi:hypothetical protein N8I84_42060 (plasmid) [Streptomyces cynarae]|uniref:Uncharacterized protein n=1 Tax=Streptomyces cynarae TaxID=2981134 RepID=A0ABY6EED8_9ACTN|nr:hypothetical protein [Streptomyces cynarae]UXY25014.1 hypothetical protein N8I84_42060 [Streptomyces cynarae]
MATKPALTMRQAGQDWLLTCTPRPTDAQRAWDAEELALFTTGAHWLAAEVPLLRSVEIMPRIKARQLGPVLADVATERAWWLLPTDAGDLLDDLRHVTVQPPSWVLKCPPVLYPLNERVWLERPDGSGQLTDPILLGAALGPGGYRRPAEAST